MILSIPIVCFSLFLLCLLLHVARIFAQHGLRISVDVRDGDCMLHSILPHVRNRAQSIDELRTILQDAFSSRWDDYSHLFPSDLSSEKRHELVKEVGTNGSWNTETMDLAFHVLSKALGVGVLHYFLCPSCFLSPCHK